MILEALRVLLFGMLGIFIVMAIIYGVIVLLSKISSWANRRAESVVTPIEVSEPSSVPAAPQIEASDGQDYLVEYVTEIDNGDSDYPVDGDFGYADDLLYDDDVTYEDVIYIDEPVYENVES